MLRQFGRPALLHGGALPQALLYPRNETLLLPVDGQYGVYVPGSTAEWTAVGLPAPAHQWNCQDTSGNLVNAIGGDDLIKSGATGHVYNQSIPGWTRKFVGLDKTAANRGWFSSTAGYTPAVNESFAWLIYAAVDATGVTTEYFWDASGAQFSLKTNGNGTIDFYNNAVNTTGVSTSYSNITAVVPFLFGRNCTTLQARCFTGYEQIAGTYSGVVGPSNTKGLFTHDADGLNMRLGLAAHWSGANAETILAKATLQRLRWPVSY